AAHRQATASINKTTERLMEFQRQVSTNKRVERPSDDPSAASAAAVERARVAGTDRYIASGNSATSRLSVADTALSDLINQITAAQTTALAARGSHVTQTQRDAYALDLEALRDAMLRDVNTQFRGQYIFGGATATVAPYTKDASGVVSAYQGSTLEVGVDVDEEHVVQIAYNGEALVKGSDPDDLFVVMDRAINAVRNADGPALDAAMADLERALERATVMQSRVGTALRTIDEDQTRL